jgi:hypothetical protein
MLLLGYGKAFFTPVGAAWPARRVAGTLIPGLPTGSIVANPVLTSLPVHGSGGQQGSGFAQ